MMSTVPNLWGGGERDGEEGVEGLYQGTEPCRVQDCHKGTCNPLCVCSTDVLRAGRHGGACVCAKQGHVQQAQPKARQGKALASQGTHRDMRLSASPDFCIICTTPIRDRPEPAKN